MKLAKGASRVRTRSEQPISEGTVPARLLLAWWSLGSKKTVRGVTT